jgi:hypothetical protein
MNLCCSANVIWRKWEIQWWSKDVCLYTYIYIYIFIFIHALYQSMCTFLYDWAKNRDSITIGISMWHIIRSPMELCANKVFNNNTQKFSKIIKSIRTYAIKHVLWISKRIHMYIHKELINVLANAICTIKWQILLSSNAWKHFST